MNVFIIPFPILYIVFLVKKLIFSFDRRVIYIIEKVFQSTIRNQFCLSVPRSSNEYLAFIFILNLWCYTSMESSRRAVQLMGIFSNLKFVFELTTFLWLESKVMMTSFRMYYTLCPQSEIFELATVMKEQLLGDFSRKISILITFSIKFSIPRNLSTKLLDSEKFLENSSRFREDDIYKYRVLWLCSSVAYTSSLMTVLHYSILLEW